MDGSIQGSDAYSNWEQIYLNKVHSAEDAKNLKNSTAAEETDGSISIDIFKQGQFGDTFDYSMNNDNLQTGDDGYTPLSAEQRTGFTAMSLEAQAAYLDKLGIAVGNGWAAVDEENTSDYFMKVDDSGNIEYLKVVEDDSGNTYVVNTKQTSDGDYESNLYDTTNAQYDKNNNVITRNGTDEDGNSWSNIYDQNGNEESKTFYDSEGNITGFSNYTYDKNGNRISAANYDADGNLTNSTKYKYDANGNIIKVSQYDSDENIVSSKKYKYNEDGKCISTSNFDSDGNLISSNKYAYDENGECISETKYDSDGKMTSYDNKELNSIYATLEGADSEDERDQVIADFRNKLESFDLSEEEYIYSYEQFMYSLSVSQAAEIDNFNEMLKDVDSDETKEMISYQIGTTGYALESEYANYEIEYNQFFSNLPEEQLSELQNLYEDLANSESEDERETVMAKIKAAQEEYDLDESELALSERQIKTATAAYYAQEISDLYSDLAACADDSTRASINKEIAEKRKVYLNLETEKNQVV